MSAAVASMAAMAVERRPATYPHARPQCLARLFESIVGFLHLRRSLGACVCLALHHLRALLLLRQLLLQSCQLARKLLTLIFRTLSSSFSVAHASLEPFRPLLCCKTESVLSIHSLRRQRA